MKKNWKYSLLLIVAVFALTMGIFFLFYRFDNKYTARGDQAIQGILYVPDDDSVHYLAREWEYYPDVLLTPQEIKEQKETTTAVMFPLASTVEWTWATKINLLLEVVPIG